MKKKIIVAPLNWGLGHSSRCVPVIKSLLENSFTPIIASDGKALEFLKQEFPDLESLELPSYHISYAKNLKWKLLFQLPKIWKAVQKEKNVIQDFVNGNSDIIGVISDNRFGVRSAKITSVYITHQICVLSGITTFLSSIIHQRIMKKFDECWIPDNANSEFSGKLSSNNKNLNSKFIGVLSRFEKEDLKKEIDILVILSGPEPNRTILEKKLIREVKNDERKIVFVLGKVESETKKWISENITFYNYLLTEKLQYLINSSEVVICRSGYSSIMDLAVLQKKVFLIPTKNQPEQEYLAEYLEQNNIAPYTNVDHFSLKELSKIQNYKGLKSRQILFDKSLFGLFNSK